MLYALTWFVKYEFLLRNGEDEEFPLRRRRAILKI